MVRAAEVMGGRGRDTGLPLNLVYMQAHILYTGQAF